MKDGKEKNLKVQLGVSGIALLASAALLASLTLAWFYNQREMSTVTWIKTPIVLDIGSGKNHDIAYLDMGDIDVESSVNNYKDYVICVYGQPVDNYSLQLAYTTNIAFHYDVYRAAEADASASDVVISYYDKNGKEEAEYFTRLSSYSNPVINGLSMNEIINSGRSASEYQSHYLSYGDENGNNVVSTGKVQGFAEPLYFLAQEPDGTKIMKPQGIAKDSDGNSFFLDYYIIRVSWKEGEVSNNKETDIVYLTASR